MSKPCQHCGEPCPPSSSEKDTFCCTGCRTVYDLLSANDLLDFYTLDQDAGRNQRNSTPSDLSFLDEESIAETLYQFDNGQVATIKLKLPTIHCSSCLWLLENLHRIDKGITRVNVLFGTKEAFITFRKSEITLRALAELLSRIGYPPDFNRAVGRENSSASGSKQLLIRIGVVGFLFGNIMLMSFPEYLTHDEEILGRHGRSFAWINLILSIPILFLGAREYFISAFRGIRTLRLNIDVPIALGISAIFIRSLFEIISGTGPGYLDSMAGLVFFLLVGKWYQSRLHEHLSFDHDHKSYFPLAVTKVTDGLEESILIASLKPDDTIRVRSGELIPADSELLSDRATVDNSFITGESVDKRYQLSDKLFAGARNVGKAIDLRVIREVDESYLTSLWNAPAFQKPRSDRALWTDRAAVYFTPIILIIALITLVYWGIQDPSRMWYAFASVLIIACPCALALTVPFTLGHARYVLGKRGIYSRNVATLERLSEVKNMVFDKTGTLTKSEVEVTGFSGTKLSEESQMAIQAVAAQSGHPNSRAIARKLPAGSIEVSEINEIPGEGIEGVLNSDHIRIGSSTFVGDHGSQGTFVSINGEVVGHFTFRKQLRREVRSLIDELKGTMRLHLLSGDDRQQEKEMKELLGPDAALHFHQKPADKMNYISTLQDREGATAMVGDGLNDAGAFKQSDVGIAVVEDIHGFSPACDLIIRADRLDQIPHLLQYVNKCRNVVRSAIGISFIYNIIGISFAAQGLLSPVIAAILMPLSSVSIIIYGTIGSHMMAKKSGLTATDHAMMRAPRQQVDKTPTPALG